MTVVARSPVTISSSRLAPLACLPVFLALRDRRAIVAGGSAAAAWKAELLSAAGARVDVYAPAPAEEMRALTATPPQGPITIHARPWRADDFTGAAIAVADCADDTEAEHFAAAARATGVPVNVIDRPAFCDFSFGAIVNRSPLVIGISTAGAAPVFARAIRTRIETLIPSGFARWAEAARLWRQRVKASGLAFRGRRSFWQTFCDRAFAAPDALPGESDFEASLQPQSAHDGSVILVGAGPGDPELLTLRAVRALQSADVILFDDRVCTAVLDYARREARKMLIGNAASSRPGRQDELSALMIAFARAGRRVVRLIGDPTICNHASGEIAACRAAGIAVDIIPGIAMAAPRSGDHAASDGQSAQAIGRSK